MRTHLDMQSGFLKLFAEEGGGVEKHRPDE